MPIESKQEKISVDSKVISGLSLRYFKGIGPERARVLSDLGVESVDDLLHFYPRRYEDRSTVRALNALTDGEKALVCGRAENKRSFRTRGAKRIFQMELSDGTGRLKAIWFNSPYLEKTFQEARTVYLYGKAEKSGTGYQMIHPDYETTVSDADRRIHTGRLVPFYPVSQTLNQRAMRSLVYEAVLGFFKSIPETLPASLRLPRRLVAKPQAIKAIHFPKSFEEWQEAYRRLVFDEFFHLELAWELKKSSSTLKTPALRDTRLTELRSQFENRLDFKLTQGQRRALDDLDHDLSSSKGINRLLQGEVGSGKTTVAAYALYVTWARGKQSVLMAPTEILAQQHYLTLGRLLGPSGVRVRLLTQGQAKRDRSDVLEAMAAGEADVVIGTQALLHAARGFKNLGMAVIDEQHRFGVIQRKALKEMAQEPHILVMTATPIPRTLAMALYGDLSVSVMPDLPTDRSAVQTYWVGSAQRDALWQLVHEETQAGQQAFIVLPRLDAEGDSALRSVEETFRGFCERYPESRVGCVHGKLKSEQKKSVMADFRDNRLQVLIATTVVEVGIDVPNATLILIEDAERFGLAQLHQLRGRVGRGKKASRCFLISDTADELSQRRLNAFMDAESGFEIAEEDLRLRGPGDGLGTRQHGVPVLKIGDFARDAELLNEARACAKAVAEEDPGLDKKEHASLRAIQEARFARKNVGAGVS